MCGINALLVYELCTLHLYALNRHGVYLMMYLLLSFFCLLCLQHEACNFGHVEVVKILLDNGVSVNTPGFENSVPLHDAVINNHVQVVELLISSGANPNARYILHL